MVACSVVSKSDALILRQRAVQLADLPAQDRHGASTDVLVCRVREERYAVDLRDLRSVQRSEKLTSVPCTPPQVAGIPNVRGELITVVDLAVALHLGDRAATQAGGCQVLLVELGGTCVGLLVDQVLGVQPVGLGRLDQPVSGAAYIRGLAAGSIALLHLEPLLAEQRFDEL